MNEFFQVYIFFCVIFTFVGWRISKKINLWAGCFVAYAGASGVYCFFNNGIYFNDFEPFTLAMSAAVISSALIYLLCFSIFAGYASKKFTFRLGSWLCFFAYVDSIAIIIRFLQHKAERGFLLDNAAMDAAFLVCLYPVIMKKISPILPIIPLAGILATGSSTGLIGIIFVLAMSLNWKKLWFVLPVGGAGALLLKHDLFFSSGRVGLWKMAGAYWIGHGGHWLGKGLGMFSVYGRGLQLQHGITRVMTYAHNDWFQCVFELGWIGLGLLVLFFLSALKRASDRPWLFLAWLCFGGTALTQMNCHFVWTSMVGLYLTLVSFTPETRKEGEHWGKPMRL